VREGRQAEAGKGKLLKVESHSQTREACWV
jgi:hypothetical protein